MVSLFSSRRRHTTWPRDWSSDVCSSDLVLPGGAPSPVLLGPGGGARRGPVLRLAHAAGPPEDGPTCSEIGRASCRERELHCVVLLWTQHDGGAQYRGASEL